MGKLKDSFMLFSIRITKLGWKLNIFVFLNHALDFFWLVNWNMLFFPKSQIQLQEELYLPGSNVWLDTFYIIYNIRTSNQLKYEFKSDG